MSIKEHLLCIFGWHDWYAYGENLACRRCNLIRFRYPAIEKALRRDRAAGKRTAVTTTDAKEATS